MMEFYDLYCKGYDFLKDLGMGIGFVVVVPMGKYSAVDTWDELSFQQQKELLDSFSPELEICLELVINWLETKKIVLTEEVNHNGNYTYNDHRTEKEKKLRLWITVSEDKATGNSVSKNILWEKYIDK